MSDAFIDFLGTLSTPLRVGVFILMAIAAHLLGRGLQSVLRAILKPRETSDWRGAYPKALTVASLVVSAATFFMYFGMLGFILHEFGVSLTAYFASATIIGLAVGFGSQGLVQDVVTGLTLIFSDALDVGDVVDFSTQPGRVARIGLRFTTLRTALGRELIVPNRNIAQITRFPNGAVRAFVDAQIPAGADPDDVEARLLSVAKSFQRQFPLLILRVYSQGVRDAGDWKHVRLATRVWPGQQTLLEGPLQQRIVATLQSIDPAATAWMVSVTYRPVEEVG